MTGPIEQAELDMRDREAIEAIEVVRSYLHDYWISEGCEDHPMMDCMSCQADVLQQQLTMLANSIRENMGEETK